MGKVLVILDKDWADEFNVKGFSVMTEEELKQGKVKFEKALKGGPVTVGFGTNEELEFENMQDLERNITVRKITPQEHSTLKKLFGGDDDFGTCTPKDIFDRCYDEE